MSDRGIRLQSGIVASLRKKKHWTQESLSSEGGVSLSTIKRIEKGSAVDFCTLDLICRALDVQQAAIIDLGAAEAETSYAKWHQEEATFLNPDCDCLRTVSFNEEPHLWGNVDLYVPYEARLSSFHRDGVGTSCGSL